VKLQFRFILALGVAACIAALLYGAGAATDSVTCTQPNRSKTEEIRIKLKSGAVSAQVKAERWIDKTYTKEEKAAELADALNGQTVEMHINGHDRTVTVSAKVDKDDGAQINISASCSEGGVDVSGAGLRDRTKERKNRAALCGGLPITGRLDIVGAAASGVGADGLSPIVQVGTERGIASETPTVGQTATAIRNALLQDLIALGISAAASGTQGIEIALGPADGGCLYFGSTDTNLDADGFVEHE
jgi:hypothetical protein